MDDPIERLARLAAIVQNRRELLTKAWDRLAEADAVIAEYPAEETPLSGDECCQVARRLVGDDDLVLQFAVFCALVERSILADI